MDHLYAIVDIETTGGHASAHAMTEIAILISDGNKIIEQYTTLLNPQHSIPSFIQTLTGITDEMVKNAPLFDAVAEKIYELLHDKVFVAHNVNFDYSFVHHHLKGCGYLLQEKKLCTVRLARKIFPGLASYSLGKLCRSLDIINTDRHRAMGDASATATLLHKMILADTEDFINQSLTQKRKEQNFPSFINRIEIENIPQQPGVYYFRDKKDKVIYVGKAKNLYKRILSHFANNKPNRQKQEFLREIRKISHQVCGTELQALILENLEIKRLWPKQNRALKVREHNFGLYSYEDQNSYLRLAIGKRIKFYQPIRRFDTLSAANQFLTTLCEEYQLCLKLCGIHHTSGPCKCHEIDKCKGACISLESNRNYNLRVKNAIEDLTTKSLSYAIIDKGRHLNEKSCILIHNGNFVGMGYLDNHTAWKNIEDLKSRINPYQNYHYIQRIIENYALNNPSTTYHLS